MILCKDLCFEEQSLINKIYFSLIALMKLNLCSNHGSYLGNLCHAPHLNLKPVKVYIQHPNG